jgi:SHS family lactate transporter-like MFS transporter
MRVTVTTSPGASVSSIGRGSFPTEVRATASGFVYHQGAIFVGLVGPVHADLAAVWQTGFAIPMPVGTVLGALSFTLATLLGPETRAKELVPDLIVA